MSESVLLVEKSEGVATLTMNRPEALNALSRDLESALVRAFREMQKDAEIGAVILTGAGRAFCAGLDLKELSSGTLLHGPDGAAAITGLMEAMAEFDRPIIAGINGPAVTGGFELALACDVLIASTQARFADTHARVGILPGWGLSQKLPRLIGIYRAKELSFTGNFLSAEKAEAWGLVNGVVPPDELLPTCRALAQDMMTCVPEALREIKRMIDQGYGMTLAEALVMENRTSVESAAKLAAETVAARRESIQSRGRKQKKD